MSDDLVTGDEGPETIDAAPSILAHHAQYSADVAKPEPAEDEAPEGPPKPMAEQRRDKDTGQFKEGKVRHRAKSQQATPDDTAEIDALTGRLHALVGEHGKDIARKEGESDRAYKLRQRVEVMERLAKPKAPEPVAPPQVAQPQMPQAPPPAQTTGYAQQMPAYQGDPEPKEDDPRFEGNYGLFLREQAAWVSREQIRQFHAYQQQQQFAQQQAMSWRQKVEAAKADHPDFEAVAFGKPVAWAEGSVIDQFIRQHDNGAKLLYHLQSHPAEIDALGRMRSVLHQAEHLALLLQRLASPPPEQADPNGTAAPAKVVTLPKPATPLRTEAHRPSSGPPPTDGSLSIKQHAKKFSVAR